MRLVGLFKNKDDSHVISDFDVDGNSSHVTNLYCRSSPNLQRNISRNPDFSSILIPGQALSRALFTIALSQVQLEAI